MNYQAMADWLTRHWSEDDTRDSIAQQCALLPQGQALLAYAGNDATPVTGGLLVFMGTSWLRLEEALAAKPLLERALAIKEAYYGKDHWQVATTLTTLANTNYALGDLAQAKTNYERTLTMFKATYPDGPNHPHIRTAQAGLTQCESQLRLSS